MKSKKKLGNSNEWYLFFESREVQLGPIRDFWVQTCREKVETHWVFMLHKDLFIFNTTADALKKKEMHTII